MQNLNRVNRAISLHLTAQFRRIDHVVPDSTRPIAAVQCSGKTHLERPLYFESCGKSNSHCSAIADLRYSAKLGQQCGDNLPFSRSHVEWWLSGSGLLCYVVRLEVRATSAYNFNVMQKIHAEVTLRQPERSNRPEPDQ